MLCLTLQESLSSHSMQALAKLLRKLSSKTELKEPLRNSVAHLPLEWVSTNPMLGLCSTHFHNALRNLFKAGVVLAVIDSKPPVICIFPLETGFFTL